MKVGDKVKLATDVESIYIIRAIDSSKEKEITLERQSDGLIVEAAAQQIAVIK